jgi:hypothetical protein
MVRFGDRESAIQYAKKLREAGYITSIIHKNPLWIVKYKKRAANECPSWL